MGFHRHPTLYWNWILETKNCFPVFSSTGSLECALPAPRSSPAPETGSTPWWFTLSCSLYGLTDKSLLRSALEWNSGWEQYLNFFPSETIDWLILPSAMMNWLIPPGDFSAPETQVHHWRNLRGLKLEHDRLMKSTLFLAFCSSGSGLNRAESKIHSHLRQ